MPFNSTRSEGWVGRSKQEGEKWDVFVGKTANKIKLSVKKKDPLLTEGEVNIDLFLWKGRVVVWRKHAL